MRPPRRTHLELTWMTPEDALSPEVQSEVHRRPRQPPAPGARARRLVPLRERDRFLNHTAPRGATSENQVTNLYTMVSSLSQGEPDDRSAAANVCPYDQSRGDRTRTHVPPPRRQAFQPKWRAPPSSMTIRHPGPGDCHAQGRQEGADRPRLQPPRRLHPSGPRSRQRAGPRRPRADTRRGGNAGGRHCGRGRGRTRRTRTSSASPRG